MSTPPQNTVKATPAPRPSSARPLPPPLPKRSTAESALRLIIGSALIGGQEMSRRLHHWEQRALRETRPAPGNLLATDAERVRQALIGFLFLARQRAGQRLNDAANQYQQHNPARWLARVLDHLSGSPMLGPIVNPIQQHLDTLSRRWSDTVEHWIRIGRIEESNSRALAQVATGELIDEVISYLARNPAIAELVQQQSVGLAGEMVDTVRQQTASADDAVEAFLWKLLRRAPRELDPPARTSPTDGARHE